MSTFTKTFLIILPIMSPSTDRHVSIVSFMPLDRTHPKARFSPKESRLPTTGNVYLSRILVARSSLKNPTVSSHASGRVPSICGNPRLFTKGSVRITSHPLRSRAPIPASTHLTGYTKSFVLRRLGSGL